MKTSIKNLFAAVLTTLLLSSTAYASTERPANQVTVLNQVKNINKLVVSGNVEVYLVQGVTESVKVYDTYYSKNALVQAENGVLRISSFQKTPLIVAVYVTSLNTIEVADQSSVTTSGKASFLGLDVLLKDNARADINANVVSLYTTLKGNASLKLSGSAQEHTSVLASYAQLNLSQFTAQNSSVISQSAPLMSANNTSKALSEVFSLAGLAEIEK